jgi:hypothetical protein
MIFVMLLALQKQRVFQSVCFCDFDSFAHSLTFTSELLILTYTCCFFLQFDCLILALLAIFFLFFLFWSSSSFFGSSPFGSILSLFCSLSHLIVLGSFCHSGSDECYSIQFQFGSLSVISLFLVIRVLDGTFHSLCH